MLWINVRKTSCTSEASCAGKTLVSLCLGDSAGKNRIQDQISFLFEQQGCSPQRLWYGHSLIRDQRARLESSAPPLSGFSILKW